MYRDAPWAAPASITPSEDQPATALRARAAARAGVLYGVAAYGLWGGVPVYFKAVQGVSPLEVLAHRVIWSVLFLALLLVVGRNNGTVAAALRSRRALLILCVTALLIASNWLVFIWAVANGYLLQSSLGYFINPLLSVLLGLVFLRERLRRWQTVSVVLAGVGVVYLTIASGEAPGIALALAGTFAIYGLLRKIAPVPALPGLAVETAILAPIALAYLVWEMAQGRAAFGSAGLKMSLLLMAAGVITATPLLWFTQAARRLRLATLGFLQYLAPTGHFLLAVLAYGEQFTQVHAIAFGCIWAALIIYSVDTMRAAQVLPVTKPE